MADLGQLDAFVDDYDITFVFKKKTYKIKPSVNQVLDYKKAWNDLNEGKGKADPQAIWELTAPLLGSTFDREANRFTAVEDETVKHHGLIPTLLDAGMDYTIVDRLLSSVHSKYFWGDDVAEDLIKHGDLGKALEVLKPKNEANDETETPPTTGETSTDD